MVQWISADYILYYFEKYQQLPEYSSSKLRSNNFPPLHDGI